MGVGAAIVGVVLGVALVYWDGGREGRLSVQAGEAMCPTGKDYKCDSKNPPPGKTNCGFNLGCQTVTNGVTCPGTCQSNGKCLTTGSCGGEKLEGKPKEMPKEMGGMPPMLPMLPMPMPKPDMPKPPEDPCKKNPTSTECKGQQGTSGVSGFLSNIFGTNTNGTNASSSNTVQTTIQSVASRLSAFLTGSTDSVANTDNGTANINNPTTAIVTPVVVSGSNAGQITSQTGGTSQGGAFNTGGAQGIGNSTVTGFGSSASADVNTSTGPILSAIRAVTARIQSILSSLF